RQAARWLARNDCLPEAIEHAFQAGDAECAGALLERASGPLFAAGQVDTLQRYASRLPADVRRRLPRLQLELSWDQELEWRFSDARATLDSVRECLSSPATPMTCEGIESEPGFLASKLAHREMMLQLLTDRIPEAASLCDRWTEQTPSRDPFMLASVGTTLMVVNRERYVCEGAPAEAERLRELFLSAGAVYGTVFHDCATGSVLFARGDLAGAEQVYERARRCAIDLHGDKSRLAAMPTAMLAELCYERGELGRAAELLAQHIGLPAEFGWLDNLIARFVTSARLAFADHRHDDATDALEAGNAIATKHGLERLRWHLLLEQLRQLIARGDGKAAMTLFARRTSRDARRVHGPGNVPTVMDELVALCAARIALDRGEAAAAIPALRKWLAFTRDRRIVRSSMRIGAILANAQAQVGDANGARRTLIEMVNATPKAVFVRSLIDEGPGVLGVLSDLLADHADAGGDTWQRLSRILAGQDAGGGSQVASQGPTNPTGALSPRELDILRFSAQGMATSDICRAVNLSENTVKWYWSRIFSKLQVHRRFDAIKVARQQKLLA
ncbi:MAG: LuxR C-terminal-related transcriptional regulator, partial [Panacagrimonas sp.]